MILPIYRLVLLSAAILAGSILASRCMAGEASSKATVLTVIGAGGEAEYAEQFEAWGQNWKQAAERVHATFKLFSPSQTNVLRSLEQAITAEAGETNADLWIVFLGHGTYDGRKAKFNLAGADVSADDLVTWLKPLTRPTAVVAAFSSSGAFIKKLSSPGRVIVSATKSGGEMNFSRFGGYISQAMVDSAADLDKDGQTSLLEAFLMAARQAAEFYKTEGRLATEHALIDDNGDGLGTPAEWFRGVYPSRKAEDGLVDGFRAHQFHLLRSSEEERMPADLRARRDELEMTLAHMRQSKETYSEQEYYDELEKVLLELAGIYKPGAARRSPALPVPKLNPEAEAAKTP